jgi:hypothetical protein
MELGLILRIVRGRVADADLDALHTAATVDYEGVARVTPGLQRFHAATRPAPGGHELVVLTVWVTVDDAIRAYAGDLDAVRTLAGLDAYADLHDVAYFELDEGRDPRVGVEPMFLRLSIGRVARGADADIQRELRRRMGELGPLVVEAWVARRILDKDVEIAFISTWEAEDPAQPLDVALWPDISATYDAFEVGVYRPIASGSGAT